MHHMVALPLAITAAALTLTTLVRGIPITHPLRGIPIANPPSPSPSITVRIAAASHHYIIVATRTFISRHIDNENAT